MKKKIIILPLILFFSTILVFLYLLIIDRKPSEIPSNLLGKNTPKFQTESLFESEQFISEKEIGNKITLVNFFATWCKPCRDEHKYIKEFAKNKKIKIIGINYKDNPKKAAAWLNNLGNPYSNIAIDKKGIIAIEWGVYGIPETFIINSKNIIKYRHAGPITKKKYEVINLIIKENE